MKAKVIIENGKTTIILKPENEFDTEIVQKMHSHSQNFNIHTEAKAEYGYGSYSNYRIEMNIKELITKEE